MRKIKFKLVVITLVMISIALSGCSLSSSLFKKGATEIKSVDYQKGKDGISIEFVKMLPPANLFVGSKFDVGLMIKNKGAYSIQGFAEIKLEGYEEEAYKFKQTKQGFKAYGLGPYQAEGEQVLVRFPAESICFPWISDTGTTQAANFSTAFTAIACYYYETKLDATLCLDTVISRAEHMKPECIMKSVKFSGGQGGPVGVVSLAPRVIPYGKDLTLDLVVKVKKLNKVDIYGPDSAACGQTAKPNEVGVEVMMGGLPMTCTPSRVKINQKDEFSLLCQRKIEKGQGAFTTPVTVKMTYYVSQSKTKKIYLTPPPGKKGEDVDCTSLKKNVKGASTTTRLNI